MEDIPVIAYVVCDKAKLVSPYMPQFVKYQPTNNILRVVKGAVGHIKNLHSNLLKAGYTQTSVSEMEKWLGDKVKELEAERMRLNGRIVQINTELLDLQQPERSVQEQVKEIFDAFAEGYRKGNNDNEGYYGDLD